MVAAEKLISIYHNHPQKQAIIDSFRNNELLRMHLRGLKGSAGPLLFAAIYAEIKRRCIFLLNDKEEAAYFYNDLCNLLTDKNIYFFPSSFKRSFDYQETDPSNIVLRTEVLNILGQKGPYPIVVTYPEAMMERVISKKDLEDNTLPLSVGEDISIDFITELLYEYQFERVDFVTEPGQYAVRGSIVDIFSFSHDQPYRVDFFGNVIESIRSFDVEVQLSVENYKKITIVPNIHLSETVEKKVSFLEFFGDSTGVFFTNDLTYCCSSMDMHYAKAILSLLPGSDVPDGNLSSHFFSGKEFMEHIRLRRMVEFGINFSLKPDIAFDFSITHQPIFQKNFDLLASTLQEYSAKGYDNHILSANPKQMERLHAIFSDKGEEVEFIEHLTILHKGFVDDDMHLCCFTDHQIFDRYYKFQLKGNFSKSDKLSIRELNELAPGDFVVHADHGIGVFGGLDRIDVNGKIQDAIRLMYRDNDILYVNIHSLHRISKYKGKDSTPPKIYKLGTGTWQKLKQSAKKKIKDIARDLIILYAKRKEREGFSFSQDSYLNKELEASFIWEDTPDQIKSTAAVKQDMESTNPMDRLICGDVGFGKTEIAIRAAFKAIADSKQVAVLVPTTILALQHYRTFSDRLKNFPCRVENISRLKSTKQQGEILEALKNGKINVLIGTHRIVSKDVVFKDLGLLIIDEEQKFGVALKEKLKHLKVNIDTLTMTATPIPRTLQFSLMGARDLSIINTPPPNRYPIVTELHTFNEDIIREAIHYEIARDGQVFFIHNRIQNIHEIEDMIRRICPEAKTVVAHGKTNGKDLENIMLDFMAGDFDVLIATTIIENGVDIPNANTIIVHDAQNFGLSDLHQLRGRVGRSNKKAFCYLITPPLTVVTPEARRRLRAIESYSELGSGFNIALQDLDIRGAGNLLGGEQSGFIANIGFETYQRILNEAILELKETEFRDQYTMPETTDEDDGKNVQEELKFVSDCSVDTDLEVLFPDYFISNVSERIKLYRELDSIPDEGRLQAFESQLKDRFGPLPNECKALADIVRLRWIAIDLGIEKIILKQKILIAYFVTNPQSLYFQSPMFVRILHYVQQRPNLFKMKEKGDKLTLIIQQIDSIKSAITLLSKIRDEHHHS